MLNVTLKGIWAHKRRLVGTVLAVLLGVAFLAGTLVLGDTMRAGFDSLFTDANAGIDAVVRGDTEIGDEETAERGLLDLSLVDEISAIDGVAAAEPLIQRLGQLVDRDGDPVGGNGPPTIATSWVADDALNPWDVVEGREPRAPGEVVLSRGSADEANLEVGDSATVLTPTPVDVRIVGLTTLDGQDGLGAATFVAFTLEDAQRYLVAQPGKVTSIVVAAESGVSEDELVERLDSVLPATVEALSGATLTDEDNEEINDDFLGFFETFLLVFAGIALLVGSFSIYNTFSIIIAQRTRESALLRAIGASRAQVLASIAGEAVLLGLLASALGLAAGIGLAAGALQLMEAAGFDLPDAGLAVHTSTVVWAFAVGLSVTAAASIFPAVRASRVAPLAALRDVAVDRSGSSRWRALVGGALTALGTTMVVTSAVSDADSALRTAGLGATLTIVGVVTLGPVVAKPVTAVLGAPLQRLRRVTGRLAQQNAMRNPRRTAATASALMIGVAVVTLFTVFASSVKAAIDDEVDKSFGGDLVIASRDFSGAGLSPQLASDVDALPEVANATGWGLGAARIAGEEVDLTVVDPPKFAAIFDVGVVAGSMDDLAPSEIAVSEREASDKGWDIGTRLEVTFAADGTTEVLTVGALYETTTSAGNFILPVDAWTPHASQPSDIVVMIDLADGVDEEAGRAAVQDVADRYYAPDVQDRDEYTDSVAGEIDVFLTVVYGMLALAIVIASMGIANTLSLSVHERTRELGLLRAVGQTRGQLRAMVRWESVIVALFGTLGGVAVGLFLGWAFVEVISRLEDVQAPYAVPVGQVLMVVGVGAAVGVVAGFRPARRAAKLDVLQAIAVE